VTVNCASNEEPALARLPPSSLRSSRAAAWIVVAVLLAPATAAAQERDADALIEHGLELREHGRDDEALGEFKRAYALAPTPRALTQLGFAEQAVGRWVASDRHLRDALQAAADPWIAAHRGVIEGAIAVIGKHVGVLDVRGSVPGAVVLLDGANVATLPLREPLRVEAGTRTLEVHAPGYYTISRTVVVSPEGTTRETLDLVPRLDGPGEDTHAPPPRGRHEAPPPPPAGGGAQRALGYVGLAAAGALVASGVIGLVERQAQIGAYNDDSTCPGLASPVQPAACAGHVSSASTWETVSVASFIGAAVLAAGGVTLLLTAPRATAGLPAPSALVACSGGWRSVSCGVAF